jgi:ethanolamine utilization protein EutN
MQLARVIGDVVASRKEPAYDGIPLLVIQPIAADGTDIGRPLVAVDAVGAGVGERVFFVRGKEASFPFYPKEVPADAGIVGIVDHWTTNESEARGPTTAPEGRGPAKPERESGPTKAEGGRGLQPRRS